MKGSRHSRSFVGWLASLRRHGTADKLTRLSIARQGGIACIGAVLGEDGVASWRPRGRSFVVGHGQEATVLLPGRFRLDRFAAGWFGATC